MSRAVWSSVENGAGTFLSNELFGQSENGITTFQEALNLIRRKVLSEVLLEHRFIEFFEFRKQDTRKRCEGPRIFQLIERPECAGMIDQADLPVGRDEQISHVAVRVVDQIVPKPYLRDLLHPIDSVRRSEFLL